MLGLFRHLPTFAYHSFGYICPPHSSVVIEIGLEEGVTLVFSLPCDVPILDLGSFQSNNNACAQSYRALGA